jgi:hypothetical protein
VGAKLFDDFLLFLDVEHKLSWSRFSESSGARPGKPRKTPDS